MTANKCATVHAVLLSYDYEVGDEVLCVCSTSESAEQRAEQARLVYPCGHVRTVPYAVDGRTPWETDHDR